MKYEPKRKIVRLVRSRDWGAVIPNEMVEEAKLILEFSYLLAVSCSEQVTAIAKDEKTEN